MWVEQFPNAKVLVNREAVSAMIKNVKSADFTAIGLDVKGPEGYVSYRKNDLSHCPYYTATSIRRRKWKIPDLICFKLFWKKPMQQALKCMLVSISLRKVI